MKQEIVFSIDSKTEHVMEVIQNLSTYPKWLSIIDKVKKEPNDEAWEVTVKAQIGPISRSKKLRMVLTKKTSNSIEFYRKELNRDNYSNWIMKATANENKSTQTTELIIQLDYDGSLWSPMLQTIIDKEKDKSQKRLEEYIDSNYA